MDSKTKSGMRRYGQDLVSAFPRRENFNSIGTIPVQGEFYDLL